MVSQRFPIREQEVDAVADRLIGKPFERGARGPVRYDCFGLLYAMFEGCGIELEDPFSQSTVDPRCFRRFRRQFRRLFQGETIQALDVIQQRRSSAHVSVYLSRGFALDTYEEAFRVPRENIAPFTIGVWRYRCRAES